VAEMILLVGMQFSSFPILFSFSLFFSLFEFTGEPTREETVCLGQSEGGKKKKGGSLLVAACGDTEN
jgi:hypothetical protein